MNLAKYGSRKYHLAILTMLMLFALAWNGKLTSIAAAAILGGAGIYTHYNLKQKRELAQAQLEAAVELP